MNHQGRGGEEDTGNRGEEIQGDRWGGGGDTGRWEGGHRKMGRGAGETERGENKGKEGGGREGRDGREEDRGEGDGERREDER